VEGQERATLPLQEAPANPTEVGVLGCPSQLSQVQVGVWAFVPPHLAAVGGEPLRLVWPWLRGLSSAEPLPSEAGRTAHTSSSRGWPSRYHESVSTAAVL
jgi:hypothetical protein